MAVPTATYMGWNLRHKNFGAGGVLAGLHGSYLEFPKTPEERKKSGVPRLSLTERYPHRAVFLERYTDAVLRLRRERLLLDADVVELLQKAADLSLE